jgi:[protein-PII] uridylyltransferase
VTLCDPLPRPGTLRVAVIGRAPGVWHVDVAARDRPGLLACEAGVLADHRLDVASAVAATWGDGCAIGAFEVRGSRAPDVERLTADITTALEQPLTSRPVADVELDFDDAASPWHTVLTARADDRAGLLHALTTAVAIAGADVHAARVQTEDGRVVDVFELTDTKGSKLTQDAHARIRTLLREGVTARRRRRWRRRPLLGPASELVRRTPRPA